MRKATPHVLIAVLLLGAVTALAEKPTDSCGTAKVIPLTGEEPAAKIVVDPPLPEPLASRGVAIIHYCAQNLRLLPVFGGCADCFPADRTRPRESRRLLLGVGGGERQSSYPAGSGPRPA